MGRSFLPWMDELLLFGNKTSGIKGHLTGVHFTTLGEHMYINIQSLCPKNIC